MEQAKDVQSEQGDRTLSETTTIGTPSIPRPETPSTTQPPSEHAPSTTPTTPSSVQQAHAAPAPKTPGSAKAPHRPVALPILPALPKVLSKPSPAASETRQDPPKDKPIEIKVASSDTVAAQSDSEEAAKKVEAEEAKPAEASGAPKSWANLFKGSAQAAAAADAGQPGSSTTVATGGFAKVNNESLTDALFSFSASVQDAKIAFLEPRGLVNTGNMCYMNSVSHYFYMYPSSL